MTICALVAVTASAQGPQTVGLFTHTAGSLDSGYVMFQSQDGATYLIDKCGLVVHHWQSQALPNLSVYLQDDGSILKPGLFLGGVHPPGGLVQRIDWDGHLLWQFALADSVNHQHHDVCPLPNGNILVLMTDIRTKAAAHAAGYDSSRADLNLTSEQIIELKPVGADSAEIVWRWRLWDHLVQERDATKPNYGTVANHPELIDLNFPPGIGGDDWIHANGIAYNAEFDQVMMSSRNFSEVWIVDHSATTAEAASHAGGRRGKGGDLLYRWGNPLAYQHGTAADQKFFGQHAAMWIPPGLPHAGHIIVFNNGATRPGDKFSTVDIIAPAVDADGNYNTSTLPMLPAAQEWVYEGSVPADLFSPAVGSAQMLSNGNVLLCEGDFGTFVEVDSLKNVVWKYVSPIGIEGVVAQGNPIGGNLVFRCTYYPKSSRAFAGRTLVAGLPIELNPLPNTCTLNDGMSAVDQQIGRESSAGSPVDAFMAYPNPATDRITISDEYSADRLALFNMLGERCAVERSGRSLDVSHLPAGVYSLAVVHAGASASKLVRIVK